MTRTLIISLICSIIELYLQELLRSELTYFTYLLNICQANITALHAARLQQCSRKRMQVQQSKKKRKKSCFFFDFEKKRNVKVITFEVLETTQSVFVL